MKSKEIREFSVKDLAERIETEKTNLATMKINHSISPMENSSKIKEARRNIARMITILQQKQLNDKK